MGEKARANIEQLMNEVSKEVNDRGLEELVKKAGITCYKHIQSCAGTEKTNALIRYVCNVPKGQPVSKEKAAIGAFWLALSFVDKSDLVDEDSIGA